jgi:hypothetical protein
MNAYRGAKTSSLPLCLTSWWLLGCAYLSTAGWVLSLAGALNPTGYMVAFACGIAGVLLLGRPWHHPSRASPRLGKSSWRYKHLLPLLFLLYAALAFLGGALYAPANYDALTYRLPRVLHWLADDRWHWIETSNERMNLAASGFEWLMAPIVALARSDRPLFLINVMAYLLMPGMVYGAFTRLGISRRVAWHWMWLLPAGYCYAAQAGSVGNDMIAAVFLLAAIGYTLRARESGRIRDLGLGAIAAALLTGAKASNLPLLLPWAVAALGSLRLVRARPVVCGALALWWVGVSFFPIALTNAYYTGDWAGDPTNKSRFKIESPAYGVLGNGLLLLTANTAPPIMPFATAINEKLQQKLQSPFFQNLLRYYPTFGLGFSWPEVAQEESAGIGVGLATLLVVTSVAAAGVRRRQRNEAAGYSASRAAPSAFNWRSRVSPASRSGGMIVCVAAWVALLFFMAKLGTEAAGRHVSPYYPLMFASFLFLPGNAMLVRRRWWKALAFLAAFSALPALILSAPRPLWPAQDVFRILEQLMPGSRLVERAATVYAVYAARSDALGPLRKYLPPGAETIGFLGTPDEPETALWRPFGTRRVVDVTKENEQQLLDKGVSTLVLSSYGVQETYGYSLDDWLQQRHPRILGREKLSVFVRRGPEDWVVVKTNN